MTMYSLPNFCRVCLKYDKSLIDLEHIENEPNETLISKLHQCVSEVEWNLFKPLMCHPCIKKLNNAYDFKKQCIQSAGFLKSYMNLLEETKKKNESLGDNSNLSGQSSAYMMLPNQKYVKIVVGPQPAQPNQTQPNTFQNVFLNIVPTTTTTLNANTSDIITNNNTDTNQNVFLNINNTFQKFIPIPTQLDPNQLQQQFLTNNINVNQLLTESKTEELSVEIDPTDFDLENDENNSENDDECDEIEKDWDEVISHSQILTNDIKQLNSTTTISKLNGDNKYQNGNNSNNQKYHTNNYVPILPKQSPDDFLNSGQHFLSSSSNLCSNNKDYICELCHKNFFNIKALKYHLKEFHLGKAPFKCEYCYRDFVIRKDYEMCLRSHKNETDALNPTITLSDLQNSSTTTTSSSQLSSNQSDNNQSGDENGDYPCEICLRQFTSSTGLLRHKVRKHNQKTKKKYFIKGMKNARCDICNREFSTQSYMQLHRKLHLRDDIGYKYKVFGKSVYNNNSLIDNNSIKQNNCKIGQLSDDSDTDNDENHHIIQNQHLLLSESSNNENIDVNKMDLDEEDRLIINEDDCGDEDDDDDDDDYNSDNKK